MLGRRLLTVLVEAQVSRSHLHSGPYARLHLQQQHATMGKVAGMTTRQHRLTSLMQASAHGDVRSLRNDDANAPMKETSGRRMASCLE